MYSFETPAKKYYAIFSQNYQQQFASFQFWRPMTYAIFFMLLFFSLPSAFGLFTNSLNIATEYKLIITLVICFLLMTILYNFLFHHFLQRARKAVDILDQEVGLTLPIIDDILANMDLRSPFSQLTGILKNDFDNIKSLSLFILGAISSIFVNLISNDATKGLAKLEDTLSLILTVLEMIMFIFLAYLLIIYLIKIPYRYFTLKSSLFTTALRIKKSELIAQEK